ncbi:MAG: 30S ribosomal protein S20 [Phycisphaerae bacterium]|nr:30S ribosomal protein S20 [Phycisphaerae bacterium]
MAKSVSAKKRIRQNARLRDRNRGRKTRLKNELRKARAAADSGDAAQAQAELRSASKVIDQIASKGTIHKNKASRLKSRLAKRANKAKTRSA